jgi:CBS domain containing-hemolysin-like protein
MTMLLGALVALAVAGLLFFSLVEMAFGLLMRLPERLEAEREGEHGALGPYLQDPLEFFVPARLMRGTCLILALVLLAQPLGSGWMPALVLFLTGLAIVIGVGQVLPAAIVRRQPERYLELLLPAFTVVANVIAPITMIVVSWLAPAERRARPEPRRGARGENGGAPPPEPAAGTTREAEEVAESRLLRSAVDFGETLVREVMTPRPDIVAIEADASIEDLRRLVREQEYSRLPVFTENLDNIVGLIVVKDLIQQTDMPAATQSVSTIMRPAAFVPETKRVADLLREFQQGRFQLAIVVDEYGGTAGLVTMEDVVEELVGEIRDEYDLEAEPIVQEHEQTFVFSAKVAIGDMTDRLGIEIEDGGFETVGGYVLTRAGRVPAVGERIRADGLNIEILEAERRRIHKVRIWREPPAEEEPA